MPRLWRQIIKGEEGQALPIVLILLVVGGLTIAPTLNHVSTSLNAGRTIEENVKGIYAAEAGVEYVLWQITNGDEPDEELSENVNELEVTMETEKLGKQDGNYALYHDKFEEMGEHPDWLTVNGEMLLLEGDTYKYTITFTWGPDEPDEDESVRLDEVGVWLPIGFSYESGSASDPAYGNFAQYEPTETPRLSGTLMLSWKPDKKKDAPRLYSPFDQKTQIFRITRITGDGSQEGDHVWAKTNRRDVVVASDLAGTLYSITATATRPGDDEVIARVRADVLWYDDENEETGEISIIRWQINPEDEG